MSHRQKYLDTLAEIVPAGLVGVSVWLGLVAPGSANQPPAKLQGASTATVSERLAAIRDAVSVLAEEDGNEASTADSNTRLAWGNGWRNWGWYRPWRGWGLAQLTQLAQLAELEQLVAQLVGLRGMRSPVDWPFARMIGLAAVLVAADGAHPVSAGAMLDQVTYAVDGAESSHGNDPRMWRLEPDGPQGPMQVSAAAAADVGGGDRSDVSQNRALGRAYLARLYRRYGSWPDAIAAYNWGPGRLDGWISFGRPLDKFPAAVQRYRNRVLVKSGLPAVEGAEPTSQWANLRLERLERLRLQAKRELAERLRGRGRHDSVALLYAEIMRSTATFVP